MKVILDFLSKEVQTGDWVITIGSGYRHLSVGRVVSVAAKTVQVVINGHHQSYRVEYFVKITEEEAFGKLNPAQREDLERKFNIALGIILKAS